MTHRIQIDNVRLSYEEFKKEVDAYMARVHATNLRFEELADRIQPVLDHGDLAMSERLNIQRLNIRRAWDNVNRNMGEAEIRTPYREPNPSFVDYDWSKPVGLQTKEVFKPGPIPRKAIPHKARDYHCGIPAMFCDDLKETIYSIAGHDVNLHFLDVDETDDLFNKDL